MSAKAKGLKTRRLQISMRSLFIITALFASVLGWFAWEIPQAAARKDLVEEILLQQGSVKYDFEWARKSGPDYVPKFLLDHFGVDLFANVESVSLPTNWDQGLERITLFSSLKRLTTSFKTPISDFTPLSKLPNLETFGLVDSHIDDFESLSTMKNITRMDLSGSQIVDLLPLSHLVKLETLRLQSTNVSDVSPLVNLPKLSFLILDETCVHDVSPLANTTIRHLALNDVAIDNILPLRELKTLRHLELEKTNVLQSQLDAIRFALPRIWYKASLRIDEKPDAD